MGQHIAHAAPECPTGGHDESRDPLLPSTARARAESRGRRGAYFDNDGIPANPRWMPRTMISSSLNPRRGTQRYEMEHRSDSAERLTYK